MIIRHLLLGSTALLSVLSILGSLIWWIGSATSAPLQTRKVPLFQHFSVLRRKLQTASKLWSSEAAQPKPNSSSARDRDLQLGEPDVMTGLSPVVNRAIIDLVTGAGIDSSQIMAEFGIKYVFLARPFNKDLVRTLMALVALQELHALLKELLGKLRELWLTYHSCRRMELFIHSKRTSWR